MEQFEPNDLLIFARVAETGSFTAAATRLALPKSTVSRRISRLEEQLGERLMVRTTRRLRLTELGEAMLEHARALVSEVEAVRSLAEHRQAQPSGRLRVSMPSDVANLLLADMLADFAARYPAVTLELDLSPQRVDLVADHVDIAIRMGELPDDALLVARRLARFTWGLYAAPAYLARHGEPGTPEALSEHCSLHLTPATAQAPGWTLVSGERQWEVHPPTRIIANSPELLIRLATTGAGIAAAPDHFASAFVGRGALRRVLADWRLPSASAWAVFPGRRLMPAKGRVFLQMLEAAFGASATRDG